MTESDLIAYEDKLILTKSGLWVEHPNHCAQLAKRREYSAEARAAMSKAWADRFDEMFFRSVGPQ